MAGWIKLHRKTLDSKVFQNEKLLKTFVWCLLKASHKEYDTREMSILIDEIVSQAKELNIETLPPDEVESLKALWGKEN